MRYLITVCLLLLMAAPGWGEAQSYIHPDYLYSSARARRLVVPPRVDLNRAGVNELITLPGIDESLALKVIRLRERRRLRSTEDLKRLDHVSPRRAQNLIEDLGARVRF